MTVKARYRSFCFAVITFFISQTVYAQQRDDDFKAAVAAIKKNIHAVRQYLQETILLKQRRPPFSAAGP